MIRLSRLSNRGVVDVNDLISVIVPVYNAEKYLDRCVESIVGQTYKELEIILVDDGSDDGSARLCDEWARKDERVKVIHKQNGGAYNARLTGVRASEGKYISFVDSDDMTDADMLEYLYGLIISGDYGFSSCSYRLAGMGTDTAVQEQDVKIKKYNFDEIIKNLYNDSLWSLCLKLFRREVFDAALNDMPPCCELTVSEDLLLNYYLFKGCQRAVVSDKKLYTYYRHGESVMAKPINEKRISDSMTAYRLIEQDMDKGTAAYSYHIANMLLNDFSLLKQTIIRKSCPESRRLIRDEIIKYKKFIFSKENAYAFGIKYKLGAILLQVCPSLYSLMIRLKK